MDIDVGKLEAYVADLRGLLKDSLLATDIWVRSTGLSLIGYNQQPAAVALFNQLTQDISTILGESGFPGLSKYYMIDLENDNSMVVIKHGDDLLQGVLLDSKKANMGVLFSLVIPRSFASIAAARG